MSSIRSRAAALAVVAAIGLGALSTGTAYAAPVPSVASVAEATPAVSAAPSAPTRIPMNSVLARNQAWYSPNGHVQLAMQGDGNVVLYRDTTPIWVARGAMPNGNILAMQGDGNLVVYAADSTPLWWSGTGGHPGAELTVYNEGAIAVELNGKILWTSAPPAPNPNPYPCPPWGPPYPGQYIPPWCPVWPFPS
ncbi:hypothetical protein OG689_05360 [Kitasatospora sp. NBC_00240]|uniref:hypothetical protein n=1 Tax=Kitasatospora sp. NBC_00240 TaxID=2903567 RepID=UPI0022518D2D|nr:hypothetical protein [Kitasatospora sp. NBC_00240]MCX5208726.1 hypothetical protein [Kitasatospora sp. NBC_00240]